MLSLVIPPFHEARFTLCLFKNIFGISCPGCGMTRAFLFLGHGNVREAITLNPISPLAFSIVVFLWFANAIRIFAGKGAQVRLRKQKRILSMLDLRL